jgi:hypothetical protein
MVKHLVPRVPRVPAPTPLTLRNSHNRCRIYPMQTAIEIANYFAGLAIVVGVWLLLLKACER